MAEVSPRLSSEDDSELYTKLDPPIRKKIDNEHESNRNENVGICISHNEKHMSSRTNKKIHKKGMNAETLSESSHVSHEQQGSSLSSKEQKSSSLKLMQRNLNSWKEGTDTEENSFRQQNFAGKSKITSAHYKSDQINPRRSENDTSKRKSSKSLSRHKNEFNTKHKTNEYRNVPNSESNIVESISSKSSSEDIDMDCTEHGVDDSSLIDNDNENLSDAVVDSRVIKKFSYLAAALKETQKNLRAMDSILSENKHMKELSKLTAEHVQKLFNQNNQNKAESLKTDDSKIDEEKLTEIVNLLQNLTQTIGSYEQHQVQAAGDKQQQIDLHKMQPRNNLRAENIQTHNTNYFTDGSASQFSKIPQIKCGDSESYKCYNQSEVTDKIQKGESDSCLPPNDNNFPVVMRYHDNSSVSGSHNFLAVPESSFRNSQYLTDSEDMKEISASDINLISGHISSEFRTSFLDGVNIQSSQARSGNFILGSFEPHPNNGVKDNIPNNVKYPHHLIENTKSLRKGIDNIEERKKILDDRIQLLIANRAEEASNHNISQDDRSLKTRIKRYKKKSRSNKNEDKDQTDGSSFHDSYFSMISEDRNEFPSLQMQSIEHDDKISELRNDEADLLGLGDSGLSSEINSLNTTIQVLIKENQQLHSFLQTSAVEAKEKAENERQDLENKMKILMGENESLKLMISNSGNFSLTDVSSAMKNDGQNKSLDLCGGESRDLEDKVNLKLQDDLQKWEATLLDDYAKLASLTEQTIPEENEEDFNNSSKSSTPHHSKQYDIVDLENLKNIELNELHSRNNLLEMKVNELTDLNETLMLQLTADKQTADIKANKVQLEIKNIIEENELLKKFREKLLDLESDHSKCRDKIHELSVKNVREEENHKEEISNLNCAISRIKLENEDLIQERHFINVELQELKDKNVNETLNEEKICIEKGTNTSILFEEPAHEMPSQLTDVTLQEKIQTLINQNEALAKQLSEIKSSSENSEEGLEMTITKVLEKHQILLSNVNHEISSPTSSDHSMCQTNINKLSGEKKDLMSAIQVTEAKLESLEVQKKLLEERLSEKKTICHNECCEKIEKLSKEREDLLSALELTEKKVDTLGKQNDTLIAQSLASREENDSFDNDMPKSENLQAADRNEGLLDITFRNEKENWAQLLQQTEDEKNGLEKRLKQLVYENNRLAGRLEELMGVSRGLTVQLQEVKGTLTKCSAENVQLHKKIKSLEETREERSQSISDSDASSRLTHRLKDRIRRLQDEAENAYQEVHQRTIERDRAKAERESLECTSAISINTVKIEVETLKAEIRATQEDRENKCSQLRSSQDELQSKVAELHGVIQDLAQQQERNKEMENGITRMNRELKESEDKISKLSLEMKNNEDECEEIQLKLRETRQQLNEEMKEKELAEAKIQNLESQVHEFQSTVVAATVTEASEISNTNGNSITIRSNFNERHWQDTVNRLKGHIIQEQIRCRLLEATEQENNCKILELQRGLRDAVDNHESIQGKYKKLRLAYQTKKQLRLEHLEQAKQYSTQVQELAKTTTALEESYKVMLSSLGENIDITVEILTSHVFLSPCVVHLSTELHSDCQAWFANQQSKLRWLQTQLRKLCLHNWKTDLLPPTTNQGTDKGACNRHVIRNLNELSILEGTRSCSSTPRKKNYLSSSLPKLRKVSSFDSGLEIKGKVNQKFSDESNASNNSSIHPDPSAGSANNSNLNNPFPSSSHCSLSEAEKNLTKQQRQLSEVKFLQYKTLMKSLQSEFSQPLLGSPSVPSSVITTPEKKAARSHRVPAEDFSEVVEFSISITDSKVTLSSKEGRHNDNVGDSDKEGDSCEGTVTSEGTVISSKSNNQSAGRSNDGYSLESQNTLSNTDRSDLTGDLVQSEDEK